MTVASLFWVRGFLLSSRNSHHKLRLKLDSRFSQGQHSVSSRGSSVCVRSLTGINSQTNDARTSMSRAIEKSDSKASMPAATSSGKVERIRVKQRKTWNSYYPRLKEFHSKYGHSNVTAQDDIDLYNYAASLRKNYRRQIYYNNTQISTKKAETKRQSLSYEKIQALQEIEFVWYEPNKKNLWNIYYPRLENFYRKHGHCNVTSDDDEGLHKYVLSLRNNYASKTGQSVRKQSKWKRQLPDDKLRALDALDFWNSSSRPPRPVRPGGRTWEEYFPRLEAFHKEHGHSNVTADHDKDLFKYLSSLRKNYRHQYLGNASLSESGRYKSLPAEKFQALQDLNFNWYNDYLTTKVRTKSKRKTRRRMWQKYYAKLESFHDSHGHCNITSAEDNDLYLWIKSLELRRHQLPDDKILALQHLGVYLLKPGEKKRLQMKKIVARLKAHEEEYGRVSVYKKEDNELSQWTTTFVQQNGYSKLWGLLGFPPQDGKWRNGYWDRMYDKLLNHHKETGNCRVGFDFDYELECFVRDQRREYIRRRSGFSSILTTERIDRLERIGFEWQKFSPKTRISHEARWNERVKELESYRKKYGHTHVPQEYEDNPRLGNWVMNQRTFYRMNQLGIHTTLTEDRIKQLEELDFVWDLFEKQWWTMFGRLKDYEKLHGHLTIETSDFVNDDLRQWLCDQRYFYKTKSMVHRLSPERIDALESLPGFKWNGRRAKIPTKDDWSQLLGAIRELGISPETKPKEHWFDGVNPFADEVKSVYSDDELVALWNEENDAGDDEDDENYFEDEDSRLFLRA